MQRKCLKCGQLNLTASGELLEACKECGAIYSRVEAAQSAAPSNLSRVRAELHATEQKRRVRWKYGALAAILCVSVPMVIYQYTWGTVAKQRQAAAANAMSQAARAAADQAARPTVFNNPLNGSVSQVERYLKQYAKEPASLEFIEWSPVASGPDNGFIVRVKFRAKNGLGGDAIEQQVFRLNSRGEVVSASQL